MTTLIMAAMETSAGWIVAFFSLQPPRISTKDGKLNYSMVQWYSYAYAYSSAFPLDIKHKHTLVLWASSVVVKTENRLCGESTVYILPQYLTNQAYGKIWFNGSRSYTNSFALVEFE